MKIYLVKHKNYTTSINNLSAYSIQEDVGGGFYIKAVHAFLKKKYAKEYIDSLGAEYREIITVEV